MILKLQLRKNDVYVDSWIHFDFERESKADGTETFLKLTDIEIEPEDCKRLLFEYIFKDIEDALWQACDREETDELKGTEL